MNLRVGELLILKSAEVPDGPPDARAAWAQRVGALFEVVVAGDAEDARVRCRSTAQWPRPLKECGDLERLDGRSL